MQNTSLTVVIIFCFKPVAVIKMLMCDVCSWFLIYFILGRISECCKVTMYPSLKIKFDFKTSWKSDLCFVFFSCLLATWKSFWKATSTLQLIYQINKQIKLQLMGADQILRYLNLHSLFQSQSDCSYSFNNWTQYTLFKML